MLILFSNLRIKNVVFVRVTVGDSYIFRFHSVVDTLNLRVQSTKTGTGGFGNVF